ncbi:MAG: threonine aldolase, partial [Synergistaceae bacterium]|nr:threonine aldolase [Synergistaceae bacterium]
PEEVSRFCRPSNVHFAPATLLCMENTHNRCGGLALSPEQMKQTTDQARKYGLLVHLDGARVFNAAAAWNIGVDVYGTLVDSVQICLSKGLGAPVGSLLCGTREFVERARFWRKRVGGGLRQAGIIAAAGLYAFKHNLSRLKEDHQNAALLASLLAEGGIKVEQNAKPTNMVYFRVPAAETLSGRCAARGVQFNVAGPGRIRLVTHLDVSKEQAETAAKIILEEVSPS